MKSQQSMVNEWLAMIFLQSKKEHFMIVFFVMLIIVFGLIAALLALR